MVQQMIDVRPDSNQNRFRKARIGLLRQMIDDVLKLQPACSIIDVGGTFNFWKIWTSEIDWKRTSVTCINFDPTHFSEGQKDSPVTMQQGDACDLGQFADSTFDIAFSNSVIEHVGPWSRMMDMASEVRRVAPRYLVQTPYFWFPIEPHARTPFLHWLPEPIAYRIVMMRKCGFWQKQTSVSGAVKTVQSAKLLDLTQMQALFPDAEIRRERFMGITKALIALNSGMSD